MSFESPSIVQEAEAVTLDPKVVEFREKIESAGRERITCILNNDLEGYIESYNVQMELSLKMHTYASESVRQNQSLDKWDRTAVADTLIEEAEKLAEARKTLLDTSLVSREMDSERENLLNGDGLNPAGIFGGMLPSPVMYEGQKITSADQL